MLKVIAVSLLAFLIVGCESDAAPNVADVNNIVVDGKTYKPREYIAAFCQKKESASDENCMKVDKKRIADQSSLQSIKPVY